MLSFASLGDLLGKGTDLYTKVVSQDQQYELAKKELEFRRAQEQRAQAEAAAQASKNFVTSGIVSNVVFWTLTTIVGGVMTAVILNSVRKK